MGGSPPGYSMTGLVVTHASIQHDVAGWRSCHLCDRVHVALADLDPATLYRILALRSDVFVVEQDCVYPDPDGRDLEPDARQLWIERDGAVVATLRLLRDPDGRAPASAGWRRPRPRAATGSPRS